MNAANVIESDRAIASDREQALGAIIAAYNEVTDRLKDAHERLQLEVRRLREELEKKNAELRRRERLAALGEMAAGLAHEVRNPLGGIALQASMLERDVADRPRAVESARRIRDGVRALDRLVTEVLSFAQEGTLEPSMIALEPLVERVLALALPGSEGSRTRLVVDIGVNAAWADGARLERAVLNLVRNAVQAAGPNGVVRLTTRTADAPALSEYRKDGAPEPSGLVTQATRDGSDGGVEIEVADDGPGIAAAHLERIFNPFFTTKGDGTGLGLAIVHQIIEAHGGRIRVRSTPGQGATFVIWLPARAASA